MDILKQGIYVKGIYLPYRELEVERSNEKLFIYAETGFMSGKSMAIDIEDRAGMEYIEKAIEEIGRTE